MVILIKIIQFFLCFTILVGLHEFGHFIMARVFKIRVEKFYIFFDLGFSLFKCKRGNTEYGLGWLPLGGYTKIAGMIDESMDTEQMQHAPQPDEFRSKPAWKRFLVMIAGVAMNVILAIVIYCGIAYAWGDTYFSNQDAKWGYNFNAAGHALGFEDGDRIISIDGKPIDDANEILEALLLTKTDRTVEVLRAGHEQTLQMSLGDLVAMRQNKGYEGLFKLREPFLIDSVAFASSAALQRGDEIVGIDSLAGADFSAYQQYIKQQAGNDIALTLLRGGDTLRIANIPVAADGRIGVIVKNPYPDLLRTRHYTLWQSIPAGFEKAGDIISSYWGQLKLIVQPKTKLYEEVGGFISIGSIFPGAWDWQSFWLVTAFLSIILAVMNILPIPGLDGGHALFTFWEMLTGRKVSDKVLLGAQYIGLFIILFLIIYANGNDIYRFFIKP